MGMLIDQINLLSLTGNFYGVQLLESYDPVEADADAAAALDGSFSQIMGKLQALIDSVWKWVIIALAAVVAIWGAWIGIKIAIANKNEEKINSRDMLKNLLIGIIVMAVVAFGVPLIITALASWAK